MNMQADATSVDIRVMHRFTVWLWWMLGILVLVTGLLLLVRSPYFTLKLIVVEGDTSHYNATTLRANLAPRLIGNFFSMDLQATQAAFEGLPWVRHAQVRRVFPNRLRVVLEEHQAVGLWGKNGESQLMNSFGEIFETNTGDVDTDHLPVFSGPSDQSALMLKMYQQLNNVLQRHGLGLDELHLSGRGSWQATLDSGTVLQLGRGNAEQILQRLGLYLQTSAQAAAQWGRNMNKDILTVDMRHENGYAMLLRGVMAVPSAAGVSRSVKVKVQ